MMNDFEITTEIVLVFGISYASVECASQFSTPGLVVGAVGGASLGLPLPAQAPTTQPKYILEIPFKISFTFAVNMLLRFGSSNRKPCFYTL